MLLPPLPDSQIAVLPEHRHTSIVVLGRRFSRGFPSTRQQVGHRWISVPACTQATSSCLRFGTTQEVHKTLLAQYQVRLVGGQSSSLFVIYEPCWKLQHSRRGSAVVRRAKLQHLSSGSHSRLSRSAPASRGWLLVIAGR